jgi:UDP-N-acetylmuramoyl-tripeptide--D-alanyl-D-alanine ligase
MKLALRDIVRAAHGTLIEGESAPRLVRVVTDTRSLQKGDAFLALRGEKFDGHNYVEEAIARGASAVIVDDRRTKIGACTTIAVENTLRAYMATGALARSQFDGKVLAITGSTGKTTTKVLVAQLLSLKYGDRVLAAPANENNEIGVTKLMLNADSSDHDVLVVEMGARHYDDIKVLVEIAKPDTAILTNVGDAHVEIMGSVERLEEAKWQVFGGNARAILNARDRASLQRAPSLPRQPHWFFAGDEDDTIPFNGRITALVGPHYLHEIDHGVVRTYEIDVRLPGAHNRANLAAAIAAAADYDVEPETMARALGDLYLPEGRYQRLNLKNGAYIIYDAYNANAAGMVAALDAFTEEQAQRRIAVLSSMAELGEAAAELHGRVGEYAASSKVDFLLVGGEFAAQITSGALRAGLSSQRIVPFATNEQAAQWLRENARAGDAILLKGSRKYRLEEIVTELTS